MAKEAFKRVSYKNRDILITLQFIIPSIAIIVYLSCSQLYVLLSWHSKNGS